MADDKGSFSDEAMPTLGGTYSAWRPEYKGEANAYAKDGWRQVPTKRAGYGEPGGVPAAPSNDGLNATIHMFSLAQASALAWSYAAHVEAESGHMPQVRVVEYRVHYEIKCYRATPAVLPDAREGERE